MLGEIFYDTPNERIALRNWMYGGTEPMRLDQSYLDRITRFSSSYSGQVFRIGSQAGDPKGSYRARVTFARYEGGTINEKYLDGLVGVGTVLFNADDEAIGLWDNFDFNAGSRGWAIELGLADIRLGRTVWCGTSGPGFPITAGVAN